MSDGAINILQQLIKIKNQELDVYKCDTYYFKEPFLSLTSDNMVIGESRFCAMTEISGARDKSDCDGNILWLDITKPECTSFEY